MLNRDVNRKSEGERWHRIETLFHETLERDASERKSYLRAQCGDDVSLVGEVLTLLGSFESSPNFLESFRGPEAELITDVLNEFSASPSDLRLSGSFEGSCSQGIANEAPVDSSRPNLRVGRNRHEPSELSSFRTNLSELRPELDVLRQVGQGGTGVVFQVRDRRLHRDLAVKVLHHSPSGDCAADLKAVSALLEREGRASAAVSSDYTVRVYEIGSLNEHQPYLILEWISGPSLQAILSQYDYLPPRESATIALHIALGLGAAHRAGIVHGDVKPSNILLEPIGAASGSSSGQFDWKFADHLKHFRAKVTDFGLARLCNESNGQAAGDFRFSGTPAYASPERLVDRQPSDSRSDVWSAGVTLYRMLTGVSPYRGLPHAIVKQMRESTPAAPRKLAPQIPRDLESICLKSMSVNPADRYVDGNELAADLRRFLDGLPTIARPISVWLKTWRWIIRNPLLSVTAMGLILTLLLLFAGALASSAKLSRQNNQLLENKRATDFARLQRIIVASPELLPSLLDFEELNLKLAVPYLREIIADIQQDQQPRWNAAVALAELGEPQTDLLISAVTVASPQPEQCQNLIRGLRHDRETAIANLRSQFAQTDEDESRARIAIVAAHLGEPEPLETISREHEHPSTRTTVIHLLPSFHGPLEDMLTFLSVEDSDDVKYVICMALCLFHVDDVSASIRQLVCSSLSRLLHSTDDHGVYSAAELALVRWGGGPHSRSSNTLPETWHEFAPDLRLVRVPASSHILGRTSPNTLFDDHLPHQVTLTQAFWISHREVSVGQFQEFLDDPSYPLDKKPLLSRRQAPDAATSPTVFHPVQRVSWNDAILFCNWLSWRHGKRPRYQLVAVEVDSADKNIDAEPVVSYSKEWKVTIDADADGFRLPTEAQWEMACRAGSTTDFFFGNDFDLFRYYGTFSSARIAETARCGSLLPNRLGLHEMLGNVWEWSETWYAPIGEESVVDPEGPAQPDPNRIGRTFLGGGVQTSSGEPISGSRGFTHPDSRFGNLGFRVSLPD